MDITEDEAKKFVEIAEKLVPGLTEKVRAKMQEDDIATLRAREAELNEKIIGTEDDLVEADEWVKCYKDNLEDALEKQKMLQEQLRDLKCGKESVSRRIADLSKGTDLRRIFGVMWEIMYRDDNEADDEKCFRRFSDLVHGRCARSRMFDELWSVNNVISFLRMHGYPEYAVQIVSLGGKKGKAKR